jgi:phosphoribosylformylglycinamidine cyclo-ligase
MTTIWHKDGASMSTYKQAGVDIDAGEELVDRIKPLVAETATKGCLGKLGAFGGFFSARFPELEDPVLVSSVDGVGTKLKLAFMTGVHHTVGQDLVNHCVDDILACGARPLFFMDYFSTGKLDVDDAVEVIRGFTLACKENECALIGGETAEMPGLYKGKEYDLAGTIVGVVDRKNIIDGSKIRPGDRLLALPSSGLHTNGYSLARKVLFEDAKLRLDMKLPNGHCLADTLLAVHRSYLKPVSKLMEKMTIKGISHITGGGIFGNTKRVLPKDCWIEVNEGAWEWPEIYKLIQDKGKIDKEEMYRAFNLGIGMILILAPEDEANALESLRECGENPILLGQVVAN